MSGFEPQSHELGNKHYDHRTSKMAKTWTNLSQLLESRDVIGHHCDQQKVLQPRPPHLSMINHDHNVRNKTLKSLRSCGHGVWFLIQGTGVQIPTRIGKLFFCYYLFHVLLHVVISKTYIAVVSLGVCFLHCDHG